VAVETAPPLVVVIELAASVFVYAPAVVAVTFTVTTHEPAAGIVPPVTRMPTSPAPSAPPPESVSVPPQVFEVVVSKSVIAPGATGKVSVNASPVNAVPLGLVNVSVSEVVPP